MCNFTLAHTVAPNASPNVRYVVYFRVHSKVRPEGGYHRPALTRVWADWPVMEAQRYARVSVASYEEDQMVAALAPAAEQLFDAKDWNQAAPLWEQLSNLRPTFFSFAMRAGVSLLFSAPRTAATLQRAVELLERTRATGPTLAAPICLLARARLWQGHGGAALELVYSILEPESRQVATKDDEQALLDGLRCLFRNYARGLTFYLGNLCLPLTVCRVIDEALTEKHVEAEFARSKMKMIAR